MRRGQPITEPRDALVGGGAARGGIRELEVERRGGGSCGAVVAAGREGGGIERVGGGASECRTLPTVTVVMCGGVAAIGMLIAIIFSACLRVPRALKPLVTGRVDSRSAKGCE